jgi:uncharacterized coiled-coil protein SlyX
MSSLPQLDFTKIEQKLLAKLSEATSQVVRLETLAEALRDSRDVIERERDDLARLLEELRQQASPDTPDGQ